jgi:broad specificity phosphatase PhoE
MNRWMALASTAVVLSLSGQTGPAQPASSPPLAFSAGELPTVESGARRVFFIRHGQALSNLQPPPPVANLDTLTDLGRAQSGAAARALVGLKIQGVLSSPAGRAQETAARIAEGIGSAAPLIDERLRPLALGVNDSGKPFSFDERAKAWTAGSDPAVAQGERLGDLGSRLAAVACSRPAGSLFVAVSHSEAIQSLATFVTRKDPWTAWPPRIVNGSITVVDCDSSGSLALRGLGLAVPFTP